MKNARIDLFPFVRFLLIILFWPADIRNPLSLLARNKIATRVAILLNYKKIYLSTNNTASTYISGVIFFVFPQTVLIIT